MTVSYVVALGVVGVIMGAMVFFAFVVTPLVFAKLPRDVAAAFLAGVFPVYYAIMAIASALAALATIFHDMAAAAVLVAVSIGFVFARQALIPRIERHRAGRLAGNPADVRAFGRLHRLSVVLNMAQMVAVVAVFVRLVWIITAE